MVAWEAEIVWCNEDGELQAEGRVGEVLQAESIRRTNDGYGLTRRPPGGTVIHVMETEGGDIIIVGEEPETRPELTTEGEVRLWDTEDNKVELVPGTGAKMTSQQGSYVDIDSDVTVDASQVRLITSDRVLMGSSGAAINLLKGKTAANDMYDFTRSWASLLSTLKGGSADPATVTYATAMETLVLDLKNSIRDWQSKHMLDE